MADESFRAHLPALAAGACGTVLAAVAGSFLGVAGTIAGLMFGSAASGSVSWWAERGIRRTAAALQGRHRHPSARHARNTEATQVLPVIPRRRPGGRRWPLLVAAAAFTAAAIPLTLAEAAAGKPISAVVTGESGHGTTLGGGTDTPATPPPARSPSNPATRTGPATTSPGPATTAPSSPEPPGTSPSATMPAATPPAITPAATPATGTTWPGQETPPAMLPGTPAPPGSP